MYVDRFTHAPPVQKLCTERGVHPAFSRSAWCSPAHSSQAFVPVSGLHPSLFSAATHADGGVGVGVGLGLVPLQNSKTEKGVQPAAVRSFLCTCVH